MTFIVIMGDPVGGFTYHGGFGDAESAAKWAEKEADNGDWWVAPLQDAE